MRPWRQWQVCAALALTYAIGGCARVPEPVGDEELETTRDEGKSSAGEASPTASAPPESKPAPVEETARVSNSVELAELAGKWHRVDGNYTIAIQLKDAGEPKLAYFNPKPIHVEDSRIHREGSRMMVEFKLKDVGYPGSTYTLEYDSKNKKLAGVYFQAAQRRSYRVEFQRDR